MLVEVMPGLEIVPTYEPDPEPWHTGKNYYEPIILTSNKDMIQIKYFSVGRNAEHRKV
jgi:hypothetical protein